MALLATVHDLQLVFKWYTSLLSCSVEAQRTELSRCLNWGETQQASKQLAHALAQFGRRRWDAKRNSTKTVALTQGKESTAKTVVVYVASVSSDLGDGIMGE